MFDEADRFPPPLWFVNELGKKVEVFDGSGVDASGPPQRRRDPDTPLGGRPGEFRTLAMLIETGFRCGTYG